MLRAPAAPRTARSFARRHAALAVLVAASVLVTARTAGATERCYINNNPTQYLPVPALRVGGSAFFDRGATPVSLDVQGGLGLGLCVLLPMAPRVVVVELHADLGYATTEGASIPLDLLSAGGGVGLRWLVGADLSGAALFGHRNGAQVSGWRLAARVTALWGGLGVELSYDYFGDGTINSSGPRVLVYVDAVVLLVGVYALFASMPSGS